MKKSKIALRPYLDLILGYCDTLSTEELTKIIIGLAKDVSTSGRVAFLEKLESFLTDGKKVMAPDTESVDQVLDAIEALKESIQERIRSIEKFRVFDITVRC
jgi:thymidylate synthase